MCPGFSSKKLMQNQELKKMKEGIELCKQSDDYPVVASITKMQPFNSRLYDILVRATEKS